MSEAQNETLRDVATEQAILGNILKYPDQIDGVRDVVQPKHFQGPGHAQLFGVMLELADDGVEPDVVAVNGRLRERKHRVCEADYLGTIMLDAVPGTNLQHSASVLTKLWRRRRAIVATHALGQELESSSNGNADRLSDLYGEVGEILSDSGEADPIRRLDIHDAMTGTLCPIPWVLPGWLTGGARFNFVADGGSGKSYIGMDLAVALAGGGKWMGAIPVLGGPYRVLYVDNENAERLVKHRMRALCGGLGLSVDDSAALSISYLYENHLNLDDATGMAAMRREMTEFRPDWVICDSLIRFHRRDENSNSEMGAFFNDKIGPLCTEFGCGWGFLHHTGKAKPENGDIGHRGASDLRNFVDHQWAMRFDRKSDKRQLYSEKDRWDQKDPKPIDVQFIDTDDGDGFRIQASEAVAAGKDSVLLALDAAGKDGMLRAELLVALGGKNEARTLSRTLKDLHGSMEIRKDGNRRGMRYWLAVFAPIDAV